MLGAVKVNFEKKQTFVFETRETYIYSVNKIPLFNFSQNLYVSYSNPRDSLCKLKW